VHARYVSELVEGGRVDDVYFLRSREMRSSKTGDAYLVLELSDRTGCIPAVLFRPSLDASAVPARSAVRARGRVTKFRGTKRISLEQLQAADAWDSGELIGDSVRSADELKDQLRGLAASIENTRLKRLVRLVFGDSALFARFSACPASQSYHHAYIGGLLEHTVAVASMCSDLAGRYDGVDRDLLVTAALLHDIGKVDEISFETGIGYTDEGRLVGHVVSGVHRIRGISVKAKLEHDELLRLEHAVLSHHGELEWGSPKRPSTFEALLLHHVDNLDAKAAGFSALLKGASLIEESWTDAANLFRRPLYAPKSLEDQREHRPAEDDQHFRLTA